MSKGAIYMSFLDERSNKEFFLIKKGCRWGLWEKEGLSSSDLANEIDDWLEEQPEVFDYEEDYFGDPD